MLIQTKREELLDRLEEQLRRARVVAADLMTDVIAQACVRVQVHHSTTKARINRLIESGACIDAALALIELELPRWKLRRLVYEDGQWLCSLSRQPMVPLELDDVAEASHDIMPLAILLAFLGALRAAAPSEARIVTVPQHRPAQGHALCCDNFA